jgi:ribonuclease R
MARKHSRARRQNKSNPAGTLSVYAGGYGFVKTPVGEFFIPESRMNGAFDGDFVELVPLGSNNTRRHVLAEPSEQSGSSTCVAHDAPAARIVRVLERAHTCVVGRFEIAEPFGVVIPLDYHLRHDIFTRLADAPDIPDGAIVRVRITNFPNKREAATGVIEEILDTQEANFATLDALIERHHLETHFSGASLREAEQAKLDEDEALLNGYADYRNKFIFTIDPNDAKDFDDALSIEQASEIPSSELPAQMNGVKFAWRLGVHIADVSHYVAWDSSIDIDARRRATSVYLVDRVIPMLPEDLSNDLCSLKPNCTRRTMTVDIYLNEHAQVLYSNISHALIKSSARLTYEQAFRLLQGENDVCIEGLQQDVQVLLQEKLAALNNIASKLTSARAQKGGFEFENPEAKVQLDTDGKPQSVELRKKTRATRMVEEAMILANECVAKFLIERGIPGVFRVHDAPLSQDLADLSLQFEEFSWWQRIDKAAFVAGKHSEIQAVLRESSDRLEEPLVNALIVRAMTKAIYKPFAGDHYGLASKAYLHFTSPIRRYPDLIVHRMLTYYLAEERKCITREQVRARSKEAKELTWLAEHSSKMERIAQLAAFESQEYKLIEYMQQFIGSEFDAYISGVARYGIYVKLENTAEGLIAIRTLGNEYFSFDVAHKKLNGQDTGKEFKLGQRVRVILRDAQAQTQMLSFQLKE